MHVVTRDGTCWYHLHLFTTRKIRRGNHTHLYTYYMYPIYTIFSTSLFFCLSSIQNVKCQQFLSHTNAFDCGFCGCVVMIVVINNVSNRNSDSLARIPRQRSTFYQIQSIGRFGCGCANYNAIWSSQIMSNWSRLITAPRVRIANRSHDA